MNAGLIEILRREHARLRWPLLNVFSLTLLVSLVVAFLMPRTYVVDAALRFADAGAMATAEEQLGGQASGRAETVTIRARDGELQLSMESAYPLGLRQALKELLAGFEKTTLESQARARDAESARLARELDAARAAHAAAQKQLADALAALPEGGHTAAAARLGKLQADASGLALEVRDGRARQAELEARVQQLDAEIAAAQPAAGAQPSAEQTAQQAAAVARREVAQEELAQQRSLNETNARRQAQLQRLVQDARQEFTRLEDENTELQQLSKAESVAERGVRDAEAAVARQAASVERARQRPELPFTVAAAPGAPRVAVGFPSWQYVVLAVIAGLDMVLVVLLIATLRSFSAKSLGRLADQLQVRALAELPVWHDPLADPVSGRRRGMALLLALVAVAACVVFLRVA